ncbi:phytoene desaturase family protein [Nocardioides euryhalodurans]|uniref:Pyridine nucleotide-disulfide oxidoreductase domain-containing protein 2 n=1 Tax=Nocardioides euryhalodurans TaxID=2518370 RepID=A0A4P7GN03_9ACTN|nr:NAD(P)/FAD-dependent oxidoreductase [Nocardioides euryhalodurans]QBR93309.1 NAD(P)/FAD-dependent oxidoreductase [Nocardioides euryhalodurans]
MGHDAIVIGAGPNGLVAANHLLDAGWSVLVLEAQEEVGGAVKSDRSLHADFVHDTFSAFYPLAATSPTIRSFDLEQHGLRWTQAPAVLGHPRPNAPWALLHPDRDATAKLFDEEAPGDGQAWLDLCAEWDRVGEHLVGALLTPFPPLRHATGLLTRLRSVGGLDFLRTLLEPAVSLGGSRFRGEAPRLLLAGNAAHADIPLDGAGSGLMGLLLSMLGQTVGFPVPVGGAGKLTQALARRIESRGGEIRCSSPVTKVVTRSRTAVGVEVGGETYVAAGRAIIADVLATRLYGDLVAADQLPPRLLRAMQRFRLDAATVKVDWALSSPVPWEVAPLCAPGAVHIADSVSEMAESMSQVAAGAVPAHPFLLAGQMSVADPTRSPAGTEALWAYTHVPQNVTRDAGDSGIRGAWDHTDRERMADRMQARLERFAPGLAQCIVARRVLGPRELEEMNANLQGGSINGGTAQLHQQLVFRPVPGHGRAETPVRGLYLGSASAHPGGGVHGAPGMNAARAALAHARLRPWRR